MLNQIQLDALTAASAAAVAAETPSGVPALLTISQWADESAWGKDCLNNNCFGIKAVPGEAYTRHLTSESPTDPTKDVYQNFAAYPTLTDGFQAHSTLISSGTYFQTAFAQYEEDQDFPALVRNIAVHYARADNYADVILEISRMPQVVAAIAAARGNS